MELVESTLVVSLQKVLLNIGKPIDCVLKYSFNHLGDSQKISTQPFSVIPGNTQNVPASQDSCHAFLFPSTKTKEEVQKCLEDTILQIELFDNLVHLGNAKIDLSRLYCDEAQKMLAAGKRPDAVFFKDDFQILSTDTFKNEVTIGTLECLTALEEEPCTCCKCGRVFKNKSLQKHISASDCKKAFSEEEVTVLKNKSKIQKKMKRSEKEKSYYDPEKRAKKHIETYDPKKRAEKHKKEYDPIKRNIRHKMEKQTQKEKLKNEAYQSLIIKGSEEVLEKKARFDNSDYFKGVKKYFKIGWDILCPHSKSAFCPKMSEETAAKFKEREKRYNEKYKIRENATISPKLPEYVEKLKSLQVEVLQKYKLHENEINDAVTKAKDLNSQDDLEHLYEKISNGRLKSWQNVASRIEIVFRETGHCFKNCPRYFGLCNFEALDVPKKELCIEGSRCKNCQHQELQMIE
jgi:hypothetical protein